MLFRSNLIDFRDNVFFNNVRAATYTEANARSVFTNGGGGTNNANNSQVTNSPIVSITRGPVTQLNASNRAKQLIVQSGIIRPDERGGVDAVLNAAAWTYVAAAVTTFLTLAYYLLHMSQMSRDE